MLGIYVLPTKMEDIVYPLEQYVVPTKMEDIVYPLQQHRARVSGNKFLPDLIPYLPCFQNNEAVWNWLSDCTVIEPARLGLKQKKKLKLQSFQKFPSIIMSTNTHL